MRWEELPAYGPKRKPKGKRQMMLLILAFFSGAVLGLCLGMWCHPQ